MKGLLAPLGIELTLDVMTSSAANERRINGDFQASLAPFSPYIDPHEIVFGALRSGSSQNYSRYANPQADQRLDSAFSAATKPERQRLYGELQQIVIDDCPIIAIHHDANIRAMKKSVQGYRGSGDGWIAYMERLWFQA